MAVERVPHCTVEEFLALEERSDTRHEYLNGQVYAMAGGTPQHAQIQMNIGGELRMQLKRRQCTTYSSDLRVHVTATGLVTYPDVSVVCGTPQVEAGCLVNPTLLVEVLSPSSESYDRGDKFAHYRHVESLQEYVLVSQDKPRVERYLRQPDGTWNLAWADGLEEALPLTSVGCVLQLSEVDEKVEFEAPPEGKEAESQP